MMVVLDQRRKYTARDSHSCRFGVQGKRYVVLFSFMEILYHRFVRNPILLSVFLFSLCLSEQDGYVVQQWTVEEGLPQSTVRCISQTPDGYLWVGTWGGLARFDGARMATFNASNTPALLTPNIMSLFTDRRGRLWIGTDAGGLSFYEKGEFTHIDSADGFSAMRILSINEDRAGKIWFATEIGIYLYDGSKFLRFMKANGLPGTYANQVLPYPDGTMYLGFVGTGAKVSVNNDSLLVHESFAVGGYIVAIDSAGRLWFGFRGRGFVRRENGREFVDASFAGSKPGETYRLRNGDRWLLTQKYIAIFSGAKKIRLEQIDDIHFSDVTTLFEDREGNLWLGKEGSGLLCLRKKQLEVYSRRSGFPSDLIMCGIEDGAGTAWIGTWDNGLLVRRSPSSSFEPVRFPKNVISIYSLCRVQDGSILAGTWGYGLFSIRSGKVEQVNPRFIGDGTSIVSIAVDPGGGRWVGTAHDGVLYFNGAAEKVWNAASGLPSNRINSVLCAANGDVWITVSASGVCRISDGTLTVYNKGNGLNDNFASPLYEDNDGAIWIGTNRGLTRWKKGKFSSVTAENGLADEEVSQIIEDDRGNFWIGGLHGIYRVSKQELNDAAEGKITAIRCFSLGKDEGMLNEETGGGGSSRCWKTSDGKLWFSTSKGVVVVDPRTVTQNTFLPNAIVEEVWVENHPRTMADPIILQPNETKIEFRYTGINFTSPKKIRFQYVLDGFEKEWNEGATNRLARYTNLDPGTYLFRVRAENNSGMPGEHEASIHVLVLPPFYETWWFRAMIIILFLTVGPVVYFLRVRQLTAEKEKQMEFSRRLIASQESERKRIATELHDGLGQNLLIIKNKLLVTLQTLEKDIPSTQQVEDASTIASNTIEEVRSISHNLRPHQLDQLGITKTLRSIVRQANESTAIEFSADVEDIDGVLSPEEEISLFRIVQESFNNIIKHAGATKVNVRVLRRENVIYVAVIDNGKGISASAGFGISGMQERAKMFGWGFSIDSKEGTHINVTIHLHS